MVLVVINKINCRNRARELTPILPNALRTCATVCGERVLVATRQSCRPRSSAPTANSAIAMSGSSPVMNSAYKNDSTIRTMR